MSYYYEKIPILENSTFIIREYIVNQFNFPRHYHPEFELIYISNGNGMRHVGDHIEEFSSRDIVLIGSDLPHFWTNNENLPNKNKIRQVILQFHPNLLGNEFANRAEALEINKLLERASYGISFFGDDASRVSQILESMLLTKSKFEGLLKLLRALQILATTSGYKLLSSNTFTKPKQLSVNDRFESIYHYIIHNFKSELSLEKLAGMFCMSVSAMSYLIRKKTGKNYTELLMDLRISYACKMLIETDMSVSQICFESGFNNLSYFNRMFKNFKNVTPSFFRKLFIR